MQKRTQTEACIWPGCPKRPAAAKLCEAHGYIVWCQVDKGRLAEVDKQRLALAATTTAASAKKPATGPGSIYYLQVGTNIKIGWTGNLTKRMRAYAPDSTLLATEPGTRADETVLHRKFAVWRSYGAEWYMLAPVILDHIGRVRAAHGDPPAIVFGARPTTTRQLRTRQPVGGAHRGPGYTPV